MASPAFDKLQAKADELFKAAEAEGKPITKEAAFSKVYTDPANAELKAEYRRAHHARALA